MQKLNNLQKFFDLSTNFENKINQLISKTFMIK